MAFDRRLINCENLGLPLRPIQLFACNPTDRGAHLCCVRNRPSFPVDSNYPRVGVAHVATEKR